MANKDSKASLPQTILKLDDLGGHLDDLRERGVLFLAVASTDAVAVSGAPHGTASQVPGVVVVRPSAAAAPARHAHVFRQHQQTPTRDAPEDDGRHHHGEQIDQPLAGAGGGGGDVKQVDDERGHEKTHHRQAPKPPFEGDAVAAGPRPRHELLVHLQHGERHAQQREYGQERGGAELAALAALPRLAQPQLQGRHELQEVSDDVAEDEEGAAVQEQAGAVAVVLLQHRAGRAGRGGGAGVLVTAVGPPNGLAQSGVGAERAQQTPQGQQAEAVDAHRGPQKCLRVQERLRLPVHSGGHVQSNKHGGQLRKFAQAHPNPIHL
eukprot:CAMPEP_0171614438 /NCGR_PEP_ID=MMETSP0990-20121206/12315_1 /TAXON_ID=483369 /ORGANISM="non described non described, Strain CCMP2098" /LENGTH=321 /DNA_ID=CAMNT_0012178379 /DNA_START=7 /DNA_END=968 /DNA_ORIENTATION=-